MSSILPGYNYDIFISYRQRDNKYDGWITEFIQNLRQELDATFKDEISIYFDFNPDDGLLETHNVDKSLEGKLNCLILIPILSQTYCDPRSFAWQHEFCAFNKLAQADALGRDIKLRSGNVASRILPVRIRELDADDKKLIENELGSVLRSIDFIYREQGVNRPLKPEDSEEKNLNHTKYRNQINKTANAIKEIISAVKWKQSGAAEPPPSLTTVASQPSPELEKPAKVKRKRTVFEIVVRSIIGLAIVFYFLFWRGRDNKEDIDDDQSSTASVLDKSIAVLPFEDLSSARDQEYFSDGIAEEILNSLAHIPGLKVAGRTSSFQFKGVKTDLKDVGKKLNVATVLEGSVRKSGNRVRITAQLIGVKDGYHIWSETYDRDMTDIFAIQDEVASKIAQVLLKELAVVSPKTERPENVKAYEYYLEGKYINIHEFVISGKPEDFTHAENLFKKALALDSTYALAHAGLADLYNSYTNRVKKEQRYMDLQQSEVNIAYRLNPDLDYVNNVIGQVETTKGNYDQGYKSFVKAVELNPRDANNLSGLGLLLTRLGLLDEALTLMTRAIAIEPLEPNNYSIRGSIYFQSGKFKEATADLTETLHQQPDNFSVVIQLGFLNLIKKDLPEAKKYLDRAKSLNSQVTGFTGLESLYEARLGHREKALALPHDFRLYIILGMRQEAIDGMLKFFSPGPPLNFYLSLSRTAHLSSFMDDPRIKELIRKQKDGYEKNKMKYKLPALPD